VKTEPGKKKKNIFTIFLCSAIKDFLDVKCQ
jgi:hypothetical protein